MQRLIGVHDEIANVMPCRANITASLNILPIADENYIFVMRMWQRSLFTGQLIKYVWVRVLLPLLHDQC